MKAMARLRSSFNFLRRVRYPCLRSPGLIEGGICEICGQETRFEFRKIVPDELAATAELTPRIRESWDRRESMACTNCHGNYRGRQLARAILKRFGGEGQSSLRELASTRMFQEMKLLVINDALFSSVLGRHPGCRYSDYIVSLIPGVGALNLKIDCSDDSLDLVLSSDAVEHTPVYMHAIREIHRVLKPGGV